MFRYRINYLIYQGAALDQRASVEQAFKSQFELAQALVHFAAQNSAARLRFEVVSVYQFEPSLRMPKVDQGFGPETVLVVESIQELV